MIDPNKTYRTRDGRAVRIYATDGWPQWPIHGAVEESVGWRVMHWTRRGEANGDVAHNYDLIEDTLADELRDQIPWSALRPEIRWVAMDENGTWMGYPKHPHLNEGNGEWDLRALKGWLEIGPAIKMPEADPARWRETLVQRPYSDEDYKLAP